MSDELLQPQSAKTDRELLILIYERQKVMGRIVEEIKSETKKTNGRVIVLENYREQDLLTTQLVNNHETQLKEIEKDRLTWKVRIGTIAAIFGTVFFVIEMVIKLLFK